MGRTRPRSVLDKGGHVALNQPDLDDACIGEIEGDLHSFAVNPKRYLPLRQFRCGTHESRSEQEVNETVRGYASGKHKDGTFRVTVETHRLVGVTAFQAATASQPVLGRYAGSPYISVLGLCQQYRGRKKARGRLGDFILQDVLQAINKRWGGTPNVFVLVNPNNTPSRNLFERHGFRMIIRARNDESDALFRHSGLQVP